LYEEVLGSKQACNNDQEHGVVEEAFEDVLLSGTQLPAVEEVDKLQKYESVKDNGVVFQHIFFILRSEQQVRESEHQRSKEKHDQ